MVRRRVDVLFLLIAAFAAGPVDAEGGLAVNPQLSGSLGAPGRREIPNLALRAAPTTGAEKSQATHEGRDYWAARRAKDEARRAWEERHADEVPPPDMLRAVSEAFYREKQRSPREAMAVAGWRSLGPTTDAGRVRDYEFTPDGSQLYVATANGGIWRLTRQGGAGADYGSPANLTDRLPLLTFGAVAVAPSSPNIVYAATGEQSPWSGSKVFGLGTLKSTDGGQTWSFNTTSVTGGVTQVIPSLYSYDLSVHPSDPNDVLLASGNGIFRTRDGGVTWQNKLASRSDWTRQGVNLQRRPGSPNVVWAGLWGGLAVSTDGGDTWQIAFEDIASQVGYAGKPIRSLVAVAPSNPDRIYWFVAGQGSDGSMSQVGVFRSDDGGANWRVALGPPQGQGYPLIAGEQGWTFLGLAVDPTNPDRVIAGGLDTWRSDDGGVRWTQIAQWTLPERHPQFCHADVDVIAFEPGLPNFWMGTDGGLFRSVDGGRTFQWKNDGVVARMFSSLAQHPTDPYRLYAGTQDNGTMRLSGNSTSAWKKIFYGDGYDCAVNQQSPNVVWATNFNNYTSRATDGGEAETSFKLTNCPANAQTEADCPFPPVTTFRSRLGMDPVDSRVIWAMTDRIYRTTAGDGTPDDWRPVFAQYFCEDGVSDTPCPNSQKRYASGSVVSVNPRDRNRVAFGTQAGYLVITLDGGASGYLLNSYSQVNAVAWDPRDPNAIFIGLESQAEMVSGQGSHTIWRIAGLDQSTKTFAPADTGIGVPVTYAGSTRTYYAPIDSLAISPVDSNLMFAGSKYGVFRSTNGGSAWAYYGDDFPATWVSSLLFTPDGRLLRAATWGRGMWEIAVGGGTPGPTSAPTPAFTYSPAAPRPGQAVSFQDATTGGASSWSWSFGDGTTSTQQNPVKIWSSEGSFTVTLTAANAVGSRSTSRAVPVSYGTTGSGSVYYTYLIPAVVTSEGLGGTKFTTELTMTNRSGRALSLTFRAKGSMKDGRAIDASSTYTVPAGQQIFGETFDFLRGVTGMAIPSGDATASLRIEVRGADNLTQFGAQVRVTTPPNSDLRGQGINGKFGLAYPAVPLGRGATGTAYVYNLQQTSTAGTAGTRANLACVHAGGGSGNPIRLEVTYRDGESGQFHPTVDVLDLSAFQWFQKGQPLLARGLRYGYATIRRTSGDDQFVCYGILNDNLNGDGSYVPMVIEGQAERADAMVPVIVDTGGFASEMTFANRTARKISGLFALIPYTDPVPDWGYFDLAPGEQFTIPDIMAVLREIGFNSPAGTVGSVYFQFLEGEFREDQSDTQPRIPASEAYIGVRTYATKAGGRFGFAYGYNPLGSAADAEAWVYGMQQSGVRGQEGGTRTNLAVIHALGGYIEDIELEVTYYGPDGAELGKESKCSPCRLAPGQWKQFNAPLTAFGVSQGYARIRRVSGTDQFIAYGVLNDQANDDGSHVPMVVP
jgi:PKD repeat protein